MSTDEIKLENQDIEEKSEENKDSELVEKFSIDNEGLTELIGLPHLETLLNNDNSDELNSLNSSEDIFSHSNETEEITIEATNELASIKNSPTSLFDIIKTQEINNEEISDSLETLKSDDFQTEIKEFSSEETKESSTTFQRKKRRKRRSDLLLNNLNNKEEIQNAENSVDLKISEENIKVEESEEELISTKEDVEKTIVISEISSFLTQEESQDQKEHTLGTLIKPQLRKRKKRKKVNRETEVTTTIKSEVTTTTILGNTDNYIFTSVPENLLNAGLILYNNLTKQMQENGTLRVEYLMTVLGSLAGYSTQASAREKMINRMKLTEDQVFSVIETADGNRYFFGDSIDRTLQKDRHSIWYMAATAAIKLTGKVNCNINEIVRFNIRNLGKKTFGIPRIPKNLRTSKLPAFYVENLWFTLQKGLEHFTNDPMDWPIIFGVAIQRALITTKGVLDPNISLKIILESAVPTSAMEITPINPNEVASESDKKLLIEKLRNDINTIMKTLRLTSLPDEQKSVLLTELSEKNEQLYQLLN